MAEVFEVAFLGTSLTTGFYARGWTNELAKVLGEGKRSKVRVHARGAPAQDSSWGLANVQPLINMRPRVAMVEFINDRWEMPVVDSMANFTAIVAAIRAGSPDTIVYLMTLVEPLAYLVEPPPEYPPLSVYDAALHDLSIELETGWLDLRAQWGAGAHPDEYPPDDGVHPYITGYKRAAIPPIVTELSPLFR